MPWNWDRNRIENEKRQNFQVGHDFKQWNHQWNSTYELTLLKKANGLTQEVVILFEMFMFPIHAILNSAEIPHDFNPVYPFKGG